jgi:uncharacterized protein
MRNDYASGRTAAVRRHGFSVSGRQQDLTKTAAAEAEKYVVHSVAHVNYPRSAILSGAVIMNGPSYFEIQAEDLERAIQFYQTIFGWTFTRAEGLPIEYWRIQTNGPRGGLLPRPAKAPEPGHGTNAFVCSIEVTDFEATAKKIAGVGGKVVLPKFAVPGVCWQGYFLDTEGNAFGIFQPDPTSR